MSFTEELAQLLPEDLPHRDRCLTGSARHLEMIVEANQSFNLTRILSPREAAIKHVLDSILPWRLFSGAARVADAGTGAGYPGIPLALVFPETRFILLESTQKKARFVETAVAELGLTNVEVYPVRAEAWLADNAVDIVTARAVVPLERAIPLFLAGLKNGAKALLYKGPDVEQEMAAAAPEARKRKVRMEVKNRYELPDNLGSRTIVELAR